MDVLDVTECSHQDKTPPGNATSEQIPIQCDRITLHTGVGTPGQRRSIISFRNDTIVQSVVD